MLAAPLEFLASVLEALGGLVSFEEAVQRLQARWPEGRVQGRGFVRLLAETSAAPYRLVKPERAPGPWLAAPEHEGAALAEYARRADALMRAEPPVPAESARRELEEALPHYPHDPVSLALRLCPDARLTGAGELFMPPVAPPEAIRHTVGHCRLPVSLAELRAAVERMFPEAVGLPEEDGTLEGMLGEAGCEVRDGQVVVAGAEVVPRVEPPAERADSDPLDDDIRRLEISEEAAVARHLEYARERRGFRLLVLPPESHHEIARSVAERLGVAYRAFDRLLIERLVAGGWEEAEDAELFEADRVLLTEAARAVLDDLLREFDSPTSALVLGETGLFGRCEVAREAVRRVYDQTHGGQRGFWALCIPGVIHRRQAYFNEVEPVLHMEGQVLPLRRPLTDPEGT